MAHLLPRTFAHPTRRPAARLAARLAAAGCLAFASFGALSQALPPALFLPEVVLPRVTVDTAAFPVNLPSGTPKAPLDSFRYSYQGATKSLSTYLAEAKVRALLVVKDGKIVHEYNRFPFTRHTQHQSWSVGKQVLSTLVGIAIDEGAIRSVDDRMDAYAPELALNGFAGVTFKQALQMSSGVRYSEEADRFKLFLDTITDFYTLGASGFSLREKTLDASMTQAYPPGSKFEYASINSQALSLALERAVGMAYPQYLEAKLWKPLRTADAAKVLVDRSRDAFSFCCLYATTRSYAMYGMLYAQQGRIHGRQIVSSDWVRKSTTFEGDPSNWRAVPRAGVNTGLYGFGYHWWPLEGSRGDFTALGVFGQAIHVLPKQNTVIVRISADYDTPGAHSEENVVMGRALADHLQ